ncbi:MAG: histidine kinase [Treponema sp.]|nr:histidine kinase [Treponema sp.]
MIDSATLSGGIETYILLVWLFFIFNTVLMLLLCYLYLSIQKTREQEKLSREFSYLMIEGLETERRRISRELHDTILPNVHDIEVSNQIRSICVNLMPPDFSCLYLKDALLHFCVQFAKRTGIECAYSIDDEIDFSLICAENQLHLFRMVQESFNNIEKHSKTKNASFVVRRNANGNILICISDEGVGLEKNNGYKNGLGIRSLRQRAEIIGAKLNFISESENGLMVRIELITESAIG